MMWQFRETVEGLAEACEALEIPVIGGNVSFYNETDGLDIYPTPVVGMLGLVETMPSPAPRLDRAEDGMDLWLFGPEWSINLAGSAFEKVTFAHVGGRPSAPDPTMAKAAIASARQLAAAGLPVIHDVSTGGTAIAVAEMCIASGVGATVAYSDWRHLFCEDPHRFLVAATPEQANTVESIASDIGIPAARIGVFGGTEIAFDRRGIKAALDLEVATATGKTPSSRGWVEKSQTVSSALTVRSTSGLKPCRHGSDRRTL